MKLDRVHDLQDVFRKMVTAHSFPGRILSLESVMSGIDKDLPLPAHLCVIALTLLDAETGFAVVSARSDEQVRLISQLTYARPAPLADADFLFAKSGDEYVLSALDAAKEGTLEDPHKGATVIMEVRVCVPTIRLIMMKRVVPMKRRRSPMFPVLPGTGRLMEIHYPAAKVQKVLKAPREGLRHSGAR